MADQAFAERLRQAMHACGMKQADLIQAAAARGEKLGKSQVSQYVSGKVMPRPRVVDLLANILDVAPAWLVAGEGAVLASTVSN